MSSVKIRADNAASVLAGLDRLSKMDVLVGIPESNAVREDGEELNNAEIGYLQSTGATVRLGGQEVTLPPRPFLDIGVEDSAKVTAEHLKTAAGLALDGNFTGAERELTSAGQLASDAAKRVITDGDRLIPISDMTKANRRAQGLPGDKPLYAHGYLLRSITYVVRGKK
nr:MAG TPA: virion morphogenesis protein [Caudoviricetes sp.]